MRVALVLERFGDGGTGRYAVGLVNGLVARGHDVTVYAASAPGGVPYGARHVPLALPIKRGVLGMLALVRASQQIPRAAHDVIAGFGRTLGHDVFRAGGGAHAAWLDVRDTLAGSHLAVARAAKAPQDALERWIDREAVTRAKIVIANSDMAAQDLLEHYGLSPARLRVIRNGVDCERFKPDPARRAAARRELGVPDRGRVALFVGHGFRRKGLDVAAQAFEKVAKADDRFVVAGHDAHAERHLGPIRTRLGVRLAVVGAVEAPERWYPVADATLLPTWYDAAANTTMEAMASGIPAITSTRDGNAERVPAALVAAPGDVAGFATALARAWEGGFSAVVRNIALDWPESRNVDATVAAYQEAIA